MKRYSIKTLQNQKTKFMLCTLILVLFVPQSQASYFSHQTDRIQLNQLLKKSPKYCYKVKNIALFYVCLEKIKEKKYMYRTTTSERVSLSGTVVEKPYKSLKLKRTKIYSYVYDYQLIKKGEELRERRILIEKNKKKKQKENAELEVGYSAKYPVYGPVGFLSSYWQDYFDYEITGEERISGTLAVVVKATPTANNEENRNFARIWLDKKEGSILQIVWEPESILDYEEKPFRSHAGELKPTVEWKITYGIEKNGVRFPSRQQVQEFLITEEGRRFISDEINTSLEDYRFFVVETEIKN
jgi:hypothetical protein